MANALLTRLRRHRCQPVRAIKGILVDLRRVAGDLGFVDGVVAENGAIVHFPNGGLVAPLAPPLPPAFAATLQQRGIAFKAGRCLVDADASAAPRILDVVRELELPIGLVFNRSRVMALTQGISKATSMSQVHRRRLDVQPCFLPRPLRNGKDGAIG